MANLCPSALCCKCLGLCSGALWTPSRFRCFQLGVLLLPAAGRAEQVHGFFEQRVHVKCQ